MAPRHPVAERARRVFSDPARTLAQVEQDLVRLAERQIGPEQFPEASHIHFAAEFYTDSNAASSEVLFTTLRLGARALQKIQLSTPLERSEEVGLEAIIHLYGRPAFLIQNDDFGSLPLDWQKLESKRADIQKVIRAVGRIELRNHPAYSWVGTGFLIGPGLIMTNRHVALLFSQHSRASWTFLPGIEVTINYKAEFDSSVAFILKLLELLWIHPVCDMAMLRADLLGTDGQPSPQPLNVARTYPDTLTGREVYVVGHPAMDGRNDPVEMMRIFADIFNVKRLQPGFITGLPTTPIGTVLHHDCSTLGGNSGSCVVDLETGHVLGLHLGGRYLDTNVAIPLWLYTEDPLLTKYPINFS